jgi:hypothetical protein
VVERRRAKSPWADYLWRPISVLAGIPAVEPWTLINSDADVAVFYAGQAAIELHRTETVYYRQNLTLGAPKLWVVMRHTATRVELIAVTADPAEGEALTDAGDDIVETVSMPGSIAATIEQPFIKRRRRTSSEHKVSGHRDDKVEKRRND